LRPLAASGLSNPLHNPTTTNTLLMPDTPAIVGFVGLLEKV
jgi:hypothetical protein